MQTAAMKFWKENALKPLPKIKSIQAARSAYSIIDYDGNAYIWSYDGSASVAWGFEFDKAFDKTGNARDGMFDKYLYEVTPFSPSSGEPGDIIITDEPDEPDEPDPEYGDIKVVSHYIGEEGDELESLETESSQTDLVGTTFIQNIPDELFDSNGLKYVFDEEKTLAANDPETYKDEAGKKTLNAVFIPQELVLHVYYALDLSGNGNPDYKDDKVYVNVFTVAGKNAAGQFVDASGNVVTTATRTIIEYKHKQEGINAGAYLFILNTKAGNTDLAYLYSNEPFYIFDAVQQKVVNNSANQLSYNNLESDLDFVLRTAASDATPANGWVQKSSNKDLDLYATYSTGPNNTAMQIGPSNVINLVIGLDANDDGVLDYK
jgi:hypothetical protein